VNYGNVYFVIYCAKLIKNRYLNINQLREEVQREAIFIHQIDPQLGSESHDLNLTMHQFWQIRRIVKRSMCSQIDDGRDIRVIVMPTRP